MKQILTLGLFLAAFGAQAEISGSSSLELDLAPSAKELNQEIAVNQSRSQSLTSVRGDAGYAFKALGTAIEMDKAELRGSLTASKDLEEPVLSY